MKFLTITGCSVPCSLPHYSAEIQSVIDTSIEEGEEEQVYLEFHIPEAVMVETTEYLLYDLGSFVGEVGLLYKTKNLWNCFIRDVCPSLSKFFSEKYQNFTSGCYK